MKKVFITLIIDLAILGCWYLGKFESVEGALNIAVFYMWFSSVVGIIITPIDADKLYKDIPMANPLSWLADIAFTTIAAFYGHYWLASCYAFASIVLYTKKKERIDSQQPKGE